MNSFGEIRFSYKKEKDSEDVIYFKGKRINI